MLAVLALIHRELCCYIDTLWLAYCDAVFILFIVSCLKGFHMMTDLAVNVGVTGWVINCKAVEGREHSGVLLDTPIDPT